MCTTHWLWRAAVLLLLGWSVAVFGQTGEEQQNRNQQQQQQTRTGSAAGAVIDLQDIQIERSQELPQVLILSRRKSSSFDEVRVEKNFQSELSGKSEALQLMPAKKDRVKPIKNIKALLNKERF